MHAATAGPFDDAHGIDECQRIYQYNHAAPPRLQEKLAGPAKTTVAGGQGLRGCRQ
jgi:hypothetical protein